MANIHRIRSNFKAGTLNSDLLTTVTTIDFGSDPGFATLGTDEYLVLIIDPEGAANGPEIVYLTAYTATQTTGTIERGKEGTSDPGVTHAAGTVWRHGPTAMDFDRMVWAADEDDPSGVANVDFDISGYEAVRFMGYAFPATDAVYLLLRFSNDGGSTFRSAVTDYDSTILYAYPSTDAHGVIGETGLTGIAIGSNVGNGAAEGIDFDFTVLNPGTSNRKTSILGSIGEVDLAGNQLNAHIGGRVRSAAEVNDAIRFLFSAGNISSGRIVMYGYPTP